MDTCKAEVLFRQYLQTLPLAVLRLVGREHGVPRSTARNKPDLINRIVEVLIGVRSPVAPSKKGAPAKSGYVSPEVKMRLNDIRRECEEGDIYLKVSSSDPEEEFGCLSTVHRAIVELGEEGGFLRSTRRRGQRRDVALTQKQIDEYRFKEGDYVTFHARGKEGEMPTVSQLLTVNGRTYEGAISRPRFEDLTARYPTVRYRFTHAKASDTLRKLDLFSPIGRGQRVIVKTTSDSARTAFFGELSQAIYANYGNEVQRIILLLDARPEDAAELNDVARNAKIFSLNFDEDAKSQLRMVRLALAYAKRLCELGDHVFMMVDNVNALARLCNEQFTCTGERAMDHKKLLGLARATEEGGSVSVLATLLCDVPEYRSLASELRGVQNSTLVFDQNGFNGYSSRTEREELLYSEEELSRARELRSQSEEALIQFLERERAPLENE